LLVVPAKAKNHWSIHQGQLQHQDVQQLLGQHLADMYKTSPKESVHALDLDGLQQQHLSFWVVRDAQQLVGCGALKQLSPKHGELKSMRTHQAYLRQGVAQTLLDFLLEQARSRGYQKVSLETGSMDFFKPARNLYRKYGFVECQAFADYSADANSIFMRLVL